MIARLGVGRSGIDTSVHVFPSSRVSLIRPFVVPTQIVPAATGDADIDSMAPPGGRGAPGAAEVGTLGGTPRSGLSVRQWTPPSVVAITFWNPVSRRRWFHGAHTSGCEMPARNPRLGSAPGLTSIHCSLG